MSSEARHFGGYELGWRGVDLRLREPAGEPEGALVLNHGRAADENDLHGVLDAIDPERRLLGVTTGAPFTGLPPGGRHWYVVERVGFPHAETFAASFVALQERLDALLAERGIDWSRTVVGGFSQGTVMSYALALGLGRPVPAGLIAMSGFIPEVEGWEPDLTSRSGLSVYIHHGAADPVIGVAFARDARARLESAGIDPAYRETAAGHWLPPEIVPELRDFTARALGGVAQPG
ncbi:MAG: phospholipase [Solirubrobacterales bacterium]|nr:phospholipase [Solirubrobacterales bacterium]MCB8969608.1 phospholipase [Thermoleophilales bacterium]MCO5327397.1 phospholipase [Solirubrobacterales bacterium]